MSLHPQSPYKALPNVEERLAVIFILELNLEVRVSKPVQSSYRPMPFPAKHGTIVRFHARP